MEKVGHMSMFCFTSGAIKAENVFSRPGEIGSVLQDDNNQVGDAMSRPLG